MIIELCGALFSSIFGCITIFSKKEPLFYRIIFFAMLSCLMGNVYTVLYNMLWQADGTGFHVGYLGYIGMFLFLHSSYYGAINSLADGGQAEFKKYRIIAAVVASVFFIGSVLMLFSFQKAPWMYIIVIPMGFTLYFAMKLLIIPDVDLGIIKVMRPYNALIVCLCISMILRILSKSGSVLETISSICTGILLAFCIPVAGNGVKKWFI